MIIDAHTHFYDPARPQGVPWPNPKDEVLYKTMLPEHFKASAAPLGVTGTVVVEASPWTEDNAWLLDLAEDEPFIVGIVGNLKPGTDSFVRDLERFAANPLFRGIRLPGATLAEIETSRALADIEKLAAMDLELDLLVRPEHLPSAASLAAALPALRIVINHTGGVRIDGNPPDAGWADDIRRVASHAAVYCKVSGLASATGRTPAPDDVEFYAPTLDALWNAFGEDRLIYGSDWPVCTRFAEYPSVLGVVRQYFESKGTGPAEKFFRRNSKAAYKWIER